jgi:S-DNA-T family DNA segregation ATPase FtsK/SpoIIIE
MTPADYASQWPATRRGPHSDSDTTTVDALAAEALPGQSEEPTGGEVVDLRTAPADDILSDDPAPDVLVDQPGRVRRDGEWLDRLATATAHRRPIIHPALRSRAEATATVKWIATHYAHVSGYHATRAPKYATRLAVRAPRGGVRVAGGLHRRAFDLEGKAVRLAAVLKADPETYLKLSRPRRR